VRTAADKVFLGFKFFKMAAAAAAEEDAIANSKTFSRDLKHKRETDF
jgi:hypothetical protein